MAFGGDTSVQPIIHRNVEQADQYNPSEWPAMMMLTSKLILDLCKIVGKSEVDEDDDEEGSKGISNTNQMHKPNLCAFFCKTTNKGLS